MNDEIDFNSFLEFYTHIVKLKKIKRLGWLYKSIDNPESVADHSFATAVLALILPLPKDVNRDRLVKMALIHNIRKSLTGDLVWEKGIKTYNEKKRLKHKKEIEAINKIFQDFPELKELAIEFLEQKTPTARFMKEIDKLEMVLQALDYEKKTLPSMLDEFWENAEKYIKSKELKELFDELKEHRENNQ